MNLQIKKILMPALLALGALQSKAQLELNTYTGQTEISAYNSITLKDGFHITAGNNVRIFTTGVSYKNCLPQVSAPSSNQNFVLTRTFRKAGVNEQNVNTILGMCEENQLIQYFDGLGRPLQTVAVNGGLAGHDIVTPVAYDAFGREDKKYLPYTVWNNNGAYRADAITGGGQAGYYLGPPGNIKATSTPFSQTIFEASPLNRVLEQGAPGDAWQPVAGSTAGHTVKMEYGTNIANEVKLWTINGNGASGSFYTAGKLYKTITKDENWTSGKSGTTEEFKDFDGRVVLKRIWENESKSLSTYYVYDDLSNLRYVLPPAVNPGTDADSGYEINSFNESDKIFLDFIYAYHYDGRKRLIEKKIPGKDWEELIYNKFDQVVFTRDGVQRQLAQRSFVKYDAFGRVIMSGVESGHTDTRENVQTTVNGLEPQWDTPFYGTNNLEGYDNASAPSNVANMRVDVVNYYDNYELPGLPYNHAGEYSQMTKGLLTATKVRVIDTDHFLWTVFYYDKYGRVVKTYKQHYLDGQPKAGNYDEITSTYNFDGSVSSSTRLHRVNDITTLTVANRYEYDHQGRKLATFERINSQAEIALNHYAYNELGQLKEKKLHNDAQSTSFAYNERGWLTKSTSNEFSIELKYQDGTSPSYNGNISNQYWGSGNNFPNVFTYTYDKLNRLTKGSSTGVAMSEEMTYDVMGNIETLARDGGNPNWYDYPHGNQLWYVGNVTDAYEYDANGNAIVDGRLHYNIEYNQLNLPKRISNINLNYTYDANGRKLRKNNNGSLRNYIDGIEYKPEGTIDFIRTEDGIAQNNGSNEYSYRYNLSDHLGNVRATFYINPISNQLEVLQRDDYYAFGMRKKGSPNSTVNKYLYNGKELQEELGDQYDYGARFYDPVIGRWNVPDMLGELAPNLTPFRYCFNNPVNYTDPFGLWESTANGYTTDKKEDIERFFSMMQTENYALKNNPSMSQISSFVDAEMKTEGAGILSNGGKLMEGFNISRQKDFYGGDNWVTDHKSFNNFWHRIQEDLTPDGLDTRTLGKNLLGTTYAGGDNPKKYNGKDDYSYMPNNIVEYPAIIHDLKYDKLGITGLKGLATSTKSINADYTFVAQELALSLSPGLSLKQRAQAYTLGAGLGLIALPKTLNALLPLKAITLLPH